MWAVLEGPAAEEGPACEDEAFVAIARADWEICAEEREEVPVDWEEAL